MPGLPQIWQQGLEANKPAANSATNQGYYWFSTDTTKLWQSWNGAWVQLAPPATLGTGDIPSLDCSKITSGSIATARLGNLQIPYDGYMGISGSGGSVAGTSAVTKAFLATSGGTSFSDVTAALTGITPGATISFGATNDALYIGSTSASSGQFGKLTMTRARTAAWSIAAQWEYFSGSSWTTPPTVCGLGDTTVSAGVPLSSSTTGNVISFLPPSDWATTAVNGTTAYWWRCRCTSFTSATTTPQYFAGLLGRISNITGGSKVIPTTGTVTAIRNLVSIPNASFINVTAGTISAPALVANNSQTGLAIPVTSFDAWAVAYCSGTGNPWVMSNQALIFIQPS